MFHEIVKENYNYFHNSLYNSRAPPNTRMTDGSEEITREIEMKIQKFPPQESSDKDVCNIEASTICTGQVIIIHLKQWT